MNKVFMLKSGPLYTEIAEILLKVELSTKNQITLHRDHFQQFSAISWNIESNHFVSRTRKTVCLIK